MQFTLCRQFMSSALLVARLAAVLQRCDVIEWRAQKILCKQVLLTFFFLVFSTLRKLWSRLFCGEDSSRSAVGTNSHVQYHWNPRLPHSDLLFLSAVLFRVWPEPIACLRLSPPSASTSGAHLAWQFQPRQPSTITFTFLPAQSDIQQVIFTASASPNPLSCCLREQAAGWSWGVIILECKTVAIVTCYCAIKCKLSSLLKPHIILDSSCCCYQQDPCNTSLLDVNSF